METDSNGNLEKGMNGHRAGYSKSPRLSPIVKAINYVIEETTFFRAHLAAFAFIPLIFSGIFFASNGRFHISFLDSMFLCYSAMTVTGLSTVNLSTLTTWQQFILYFLMIIVSCGTLRPFAVSFTQFCDRETLL